LYNRTRALLLGAASGIGILFLGYLILGPIAEWMAPGAPASSEAVDAIRERWIQLLGLGAVAVGLLNWRSAERRRATDRYIAGLELLGADTDTRRVAGVYALERVVSEDRTLHAEVVDVLSTLVREVTRDPDYEARVKRAGRKIRPQQDVQAALTALGRRNMRQRNEEYDHLRLSDTYLEGANLRNAHLEMARLRHSILRDAKLERAKLQGAELRDADMSGADLEHAILHGAHLKNAFLTGAKMANADLTDAELEGAHLSGAESLTATESQMASAHCRPEEDCRIAHTAV
jgi:hypothetical protein